MSAPQFPRIPLVRPLTPQPTQDGSFTFFSQEFGELFHSHHGAKQEAEQKFVNPTRLREQAHIHDVLYLLDVCYGLGYNSAAALDAIWEANPHCRIVLVGLELDRVIPKAAVHEDLLDCWSNDVQWRLADLAQEHQFEDTRLNAKLYLGDARSQIQELSDSGFQANAIFLDPFSPPYLSRIMDRGLSRKAGRLSRAQRLPSHLFLFRRRPQCFTGDWSEHRLNPSRRS